MFLLPGEGGPKGRMRGLALRISPPSPPHPAAADFSPAGRRNKRQPLAPKCAPAPRPRRELGSPPPIASIPQKHLAAPAMHASASTNNAASFGTRAKQSLERQPPDGSLCPAEAHGRQHARQDHFSHSRRGRRAGRLGSRMADRAERRARHPA
ncbi:hypothetical protein AGR13a_Cc210019 [Agrobacterium genomosp. 13 str. CFBP 6927]|uniref:Uncharacterized protein n=1 Tax=Agrobacterium genomosp. 13 str. CFBP 6927 TaxID=1183428 RepID=A0ABP2BFG1_9HYPH|nr:hypothetical protein AGR13a_Cc210019 [Agrobacterium genomosp. 13 str. CFBP 6927]